MHGVLFPGAGSRSGSRSAAATPPSLEGWTPVFVDTLGAFAWLTLLEADPDGAEAAARAWRDDRVWLFERDVVGETPERMAAGRVLLADVQAARTFAHLIRTASQGAASARASSMGEQVLFLRGAVPEGAHPARLFGDD